MKDERKKEKRFYSTFFTYARAVDWGTGCQVVAVAGRSAVSTVQPWWAGLGTVISLINIYIH